MDRKLTSSIASFEVRIFYWVEYEGLEGEEEKNKKGKTHRTEDLQCANIEARPKVLYCL